VAHKPQRSGGGDADIDASDAGVIPAGQPLGITASRVEVGAQVAGAHVRQRRTDGADPMRGTRPAARDGAHALLADAE